MQTTRPNQLIPYSQKTDEWYHQNAEFYIHNTWALGSHGDTDTRSKLRVYYEVYNNQFPLEWFSHITDPLSATNEQHKRFPAKIRPLNIIRTNIDLLINELTQRPFPFQVAHVGEKAYNEYNAQLQKAIVQNLQQHFAITARAEAEAMGVPVGELGDIQPEMPAQVKERFVGTYADNQAIAAQRWLDRTLTRVRFNSTRLELMKHYLLSGWMYTYKELRHGKVEYECVSPLDLISGGSPDEKFVKNHDWVVRRMWMTAAGITERFHNTITPTSVRKIYDNSGLTATTPFVPQYLYDYVGRAETRREQADLLPVYHVVWRGKKMVKILSYPDPTTGMIEEMEVDEDYPVNKAAGETARVEYRDEIYQCYRIMDDLYAEEGPLPVQCQGALPYNGRAFSDTHASNISIAALGLPYQIMIMVINWSIERLIAKSKGKIILMDKNAIPDEGDWDEEKFFYYADAVGWAMIDRSSNKVDRSMNQYTILDMSMYEPIKQLIDLQNHYRQMWDDVLGITLPRKGQIMASENVGNVQQSVFTSNVITDNIYTSFEEVLHEDFNDLLAYSKIELSEGTRDMFTSDLFDLTMLEMDPADYCTAALQLVVRTSAKEQRRLQELKGYMQEMLQNGTKPSTLLEIILSENIAELRTKLKYIEQVNAEAEQAMQLSQQEAQAMEEERKRAFRDYEHALDIDTLHEEWDRRDQNEMVKGEYNIVSFTKTADNDGDGEPDALAIEDRILARMKVLQDARGKELDIEAKMKMHRENLEDKEKDRQLKDKISQRDAKVKMKNKVSGEK